MSDQENRELEDQMKNLQEAVEAHKQIPVFTEITDRNPYSDPKSGSQNQGSKRDNLSNTEEVIVTSPVRDEKAVEGPADSLDLKNKLSEMKRLIDEQRLSQLQLDTKEISLPPRNKEKGGYGPVMHSGREGNPYPSYAAVRNDYEDVSGERNDQGVELRTDSKYIKINEDQGYNGSQEDSSNFKPASPILNESKKVISPLNIVSKNGKFTFSDQEQSQNSKSSKIYP